MWQFIAAVLVGTLLLSYFLRPKTQNAKPAGFGDIDAPTAKDGREIPVLFGTKLITGPNVVWYGDFKSVAVKKKGGKK